jgi:hypothetical protein
MLSRIHHKLGTAGFIISIVALVAALGGGAYAASGGLSGKQKKEVEKIAKKFAGKPGKNGTNGTNGANGPTGPAGAKGDAGAAGTNGTSGTNGTDGVSVTSKSVSVGASACEGRGGSEFKSSSPAPTFACNAETSGELSPGATETGVWSVGQLPEVEPAGTPAFAYVPISFPSPLPEGEAPLTVELIEEGATGTGCKGTAEEPTAEEGFLCVYMTPTSGELTLLAALDPNVETPAAGAGRNGTILELTYEGFARGYGTWAAHARAS